MNARIELQNILQSGVILIAANVTLTEETFILYKDHSKEDIQDFWSFLDREYDQGYGEQQLTGYVWLSDGSWLQRQSYDGSEYWIHNKIPTIPTKQ